MMTKKVYIELLLIDAQLGNNTALIELLKILQTKLFIFSRRFIGKKELAEDAVQEALIAISSGIYKLKNPKTIHTWVYKIIRNKCQDQLRKKRITIELEDMIIEEQNQQPQIDITRIIQKLPNQQQTTVQLFYYEGFTILEISKILNKPPGTIKSLLFNARKQIKSTYGEIS